MLTTSPEKSRSISELMLSVSRFHASLEAMWPIDRDKTVSESQFTQQLYKSRGGVTLGGWRFDSKKPLSYLLTETIAFGILPDDESMALINSPVAKSRATVVMVAS